MSNDLNDISYSTTSTTHPPITTLHLIVLEVLITSSDI